MMEVIQPDRSSQTDKEDAQSRGLDLAAGSGLHATHAEQQTGSTTAESQQHLNVDAAEDEGKDQHTKKSVLGKVKEKAKKLKSKVKKGLKIGSSGENEEPNDEGYSDSESQDQHAAARQEGTNLDKKPIHQILEQNPQFKGDGTCDQGGESSVPDLVEDGKKPITPFKSDGPRDALQAVPTQYKDYYHSPDNNCDGVDSGKSKEGVQNHQGSAKDGSDLSKSFLGAINGDHYHHQAAFDSKSDSLETGSKQEPKVEKLNSSQSSELGKEDSAIDEKNDPNEGDKLQGHDLENHVSKESPSADSDPQTHNAPKLEECSYQTAGSLEGKVLPEFEAALSKEENQKPSFVSEAQAEEDDLDDERKYSARGDLEEKVLPKFEAASSRKENQREFSESNSELEPSGDDKQSDRPLEHTSSELGEAFGIGQVTPSGYEADADSNLPSEEEESLSIHSRKFNHSQRSQPEDPTSAQELPSQTSTASEQTDNANPLSQRAFGGLSSVKDSLVDATSSVAETVGSSMGYYSHPDSTHDQLPEADKGSSQKIFQAESADEKSKSEQNVSESAGGPDPTTTTLEPADASEGVRKSSWREWLSESMTPTKELLSSTFGTKAQNEDGEKHLNNGTNVETQDPLKDGDFRSYEESGAGDKKLGSKPEEPLVSANFKSLPEVLAFPSKGPEAEEASTGKSDTSTVKNDSPSQGEEPPKN